MTLYALDGIAPTVPEDGDYWVAPTGDVMGNVTLETGSSVWFGAVIRGDNDKITVGEGSNIQENSVLHTDPGFPLTIGKNCTIGHKAILHGCTIGENSLIGMGATVLNGVIIGKNCLIGAGALVTEGKVIPDGSLVVGAPARVVRELDAAAIQGLKGSAFHYQENMRRFKAGLTTLLSL
jgi:carbonic anhydrase/acetyltransferase-like protein (isoleucine patch superfamily)